MLVSPTTDLFHDGLKALQSLSSGLSLTIAAGERDCQDYHYRRSRWRWAEMEAEMEGLTEVVAELLAGMGGVSCHHWNVLMKLGRCSVDGGSWGGEVDFLLNCSL